MSENLRDKAFLRDSYEELLHSEGLLVSEGFGVDLLVVETAPWPRAGVDSAFVNLKGRGDFLSVCVLSIPPGAATEPLRHLYEEVVYVLDGHGSTTVLDASGHEHSFEWGPRSLFALPLNCRHRHFNASGREPARLAGTVSLPIMINLMRDGELVLGGLSNAEFSERLGDAEPYAGRGELIPAPHGRVMWETNFVPDLGIFDQLKPWAARGAGATTILFVMADGTMHAHISEMSAGTYKKGHRHGPDYHVFTVKGQGYSLFWFAGDEEFERVDWRHGVVFAPADQMFHQHFNTSPEPARYLATGFGSARYPVTASQRFAFENVEKSVKEGGIQIEYEEQDQRIHALYEAEMARAGVEVRMDAVAARR